MSLPSRWSSLMVNKPDGGDQWARNCIFTSLHAGGKEWEAVQISGSASMSKSSERRGPQLPAGQMAILRYASLLVGAAPKGEPPELPTLPAQALLASEDCPLVTSRTAVFIATHQLKKCSREKNQMRTSCCFQQAEVWLQWKYFRQRGEEDSRTRPPCQTVCHSFREALQGTHPGAPHLD